VDQCIERAASKILTSGDIATGSMVIVNPNSWGAIAVMAVFIGPTAGVREVVGSVQNSASPITGATTSGAVLATDTLLHVGIAGWVNASLVTATVNKGVIQVQAAQTSTNQAVAVLSAQVATAGAVQPTFTYPSSSGSVESYQITMVVKGI
jgi:hypothetical protein